MSLLVYRRPCEHGHVGNCGLSLGGTWSRNAPTLSSNVPIPKPPKCPGGTESILDPDKVLAHVEDPFKNNVYFVTVKDVLDVLDREA